MHAVAPGLKLFGSLGMLTWLSLGSLSLVLDMSIDYEEWF